MRNIRTYIFLITAVAIFPSGAFALSSDVTKPVIDAWSVQPQTTSGAVTVYWNVSDAGGSHLYRVDVARAPFNAIGCNDTVKTGCYWTAIRIMFAPVDADTW